MQERIGDQLCEEFGISYLWIYRRSLKFRIQSCFGGLQVRFFGTYEFSWIESQRALAPFDQGFADNAKKCSQKSFLLAVEEAESFQKTGEEPIGFAIEAEITGDPPPRPKAARRQSGAKGRGKGGRGGRGGGRGGSRKGGEAGGGATSAAGRRERVMRRLGLIPPADSPFAGDVCLAGFQSWIQKVQG